MATNLFVYGTLLVPKIWNAVTGYHDPESVRGNLAGHRIQRVKAADFPAIVIDSNSNESVTGLVIKNISPNALERLDQYEDSFYERVSVHVDTDSGTVEAHVYRVPLGLAGKILSEDPWTLEWFETKALNRYWNRLFA